MIHGYHGENDNGGDCDGHENHEKEMMTDDDG